MSQINDILRLVAGLERYQGALGKSRRESERQIIIGSVNVIVGTLQRERIAFESAEAFDAIRAGIARAEEHFKSALEADKTLSFGSPLPGDPPKFVDSLALCLGIATGSFISAKHTAIVAARATADAQAKAAAIAAAAALPADPPAPAPAPKPKPKSTVNWQEAYDAVNRA